jgi:hypothetical protein
MRMPLNALVMDADALYVLNGASLAATAPHDPTMTTPYTVSNATTDRAYQFVEIGNIWLLTNGSHLFYCHPINGTHGVQTPLLYGVAHEAAATLRLESIAYHNGVFYASGFDASNTRYANTEFKTAFELWRAQSPLVLTQETDVANALESISDTHVLISRNFGSDRDWPLAAELTLLGLPSSAQATAGYPLYLDAIQKGRISFVRLPNQMQTIRMLPLGEHMVCYSKRGISAVLSDDTVRKITDVGVLGADTVIATNAGHIFMCNNGQLWTIGQDLQLTWLDYTPTWESDNFAALVTDAATKPVVFCHDPVDDEIYIGNGDISYNLSKLGLSKAWNCYTSIGQDGGNTKGYYVDLSPVDGLAHVITSVTDLGTTARKTVHSVEVGHVGCTNVKLRLQYRDDTGGYVASDWLIPSAGQFLVPKIDAVQFRFELKFTPGTGARIDYMNVNWYLRDRRMHRERLYR